MNTEKLVKKVNKHDNDIIKVNEQLEQTVQQSLSGIRLDNNIELKDVLKFSIEGNMCTSIQSFCITNNSIVVATVKNDDSVTRLLKFDKVTYELLSENTSVSYSHANDMCYNPKENLIYITHSNENKISKVDPVTLNKIGEISNIWAFGIDYRKEDDTYVLRINDNGKCKLRVVDNLFNKIIDYDTNFDISSTFYVAQGVGVDENYIIEAYARPESIFVYDKKGNLINRYSINVPSPFEVETIKKSGNNTWFVLVAEQGKNIRIYELSLNTNNILTTSNYMMNKYNGTNFNLYVDKNYKGVSDGTFERPFKSLESACNYLVNYNDYKGYIGLILKDDIYDESLILKDISCYLTISGTDNITKVKSLYIDRVKSPLLVINNIEPTETNSDNSYVYINGCPRVSFASNLKIRPTLLDGKTGIKCVNSFLELGPNAEINNCLNAIQSSGTSAIYITSALSGEGNTYSILGNNGEVHGGYGSTIKGLMNFRYNSVCDTRFVMDSGTDLNLLKYKGKYMVLGTGQGSTMINLPLTSNCIIDVDYIQSEAYLMQKVIGYKNDDIYFRFSTNGGSTWTSWFKIGGSSGNTASRPQGVQIGYNYYDTTLNKPIWHKGNNVWVDSNGNTV